jgi:hypothetical protein
VEVSALTKAQTGLETKAAVAQIWESTPKQFATGDAKVARLVADGLRLKRWSDTMDSVIISDSPHIFQDFRATPFSLLWRGSRDGFGPATFTAARRL